MPLAIDCYNLLHHNMPPSLAGLDENRLCRLLAVSPWAGQRIVVVCDGNPKPFALQSPVDDVELVYSGPQRTADDLIEELVEADTSPRRLTVVSSDRQVQKAGRRRKCRIIDSDQFITMLARVQASAPASTSESHRPQNLSDEETRAWLRTFGFEDELEEPENEDDEVEF